MESFENTVQFIIGSTGPPELRRPYTTRHSPRTVANDSANRAVGETSSDLKSRVNGRGMRARLLIWLPELPLS